MTGGLSHAPGLLFYPNLSLHHLLDIALTHVDALYGSVAFREGADM